MIISIMIIFKLTIVVKATMIKMIEIIVAKINLLKFYS